MKFTSVTSPTPAATSGRLPWATSCQAPGEPAPAPVPGPDVKLSWLPPGATAQYRHDCRFPGASFVQVDLPGRANVNTVPATGIPIGSSAPTTRGAAYHPAGYVSVEALALSVPPRPLPLSSDPPYTRLTTSVEGHPATVLYPDNTLGAYSIAWMQDGIYVQVHTDRGLTPDGVSGVPLSELEQVAAGVQLG